jgi:hypothetical protein
LCILCLLSQRKLVDIWCRFQDWFSMFLNDKKGNQQVEHEIKKVFEVKSNYLKWLFLPFIVSFISNVFFNSNHCHLVLNWLLLELNISVKQWDSSKKHIKTCKQN